MSIFLYYFFNYFVIVQPYLDLKQEQLCLIAKSIKIRKADFITVVL